MATNYLKNKAIKKASFGLFVSCLLLLSACAGPDYMPDYLQLTSKGGDESPSENKPKEEPKPTGSCTVQLKSSLCVALSGEFVQVGTGDSEPLCTEVGPIPIEVSGGTGLVLRGSTFPDIPFEGHGLPAPITINGKGGGDGDQNVATGKIDESGNITLEGFSFFIDALGMVGEIPELTLTTGKPETVDGLPEIEGQPLAADGSVKIVTAVVLGHLFPAADEKLLGASLQATFEGEISPPLSECKGESSKPSSTFVAKLAVDANGEETEVLLPGSVQMEVGAAYISQGPADIGPDFESSAKFKIVNASSKEISVDIPPLLGAFAIEAQRGASLKQQLPPKVPLVVKVTFRPAGTNVKKAGKIKEMLSIGPDIYQLVAEAATPSGKIVVGDGAGSLNIGDVTVAASGRREFFQCKQITCNGVAKPSACVPCVDVLVNVCQLMPVDESGNPVGEVDSICKPTGKNEKDSLVIGLGTGKTAPATQTAKLKNNGVKPVTIKTIEIQEVKGSKSSGQFKVSFRGQLPITLGSFGLTGETIEITIVYEPDDLAGADGSQAVVGKAVKDKAMLLVSTDAGNTTVELSGHTSIKETPALQVYFKNATGTKEQTDGGEFAFRGITSGTVDMAVPVFIKLSESAVAPIRIVNVTSNDAKDFEWLETKAKIESKPQNDRCAVPVFDANGNLASRITDLNPVSLLSGGFDLKPGAYTADTMPLFGCVNFHAGADKKRQTKGSLTITTVELDREGQPVRNADGSLKQSSFKVNLLAVVNPLKGKFVFRLTQTMSGIMNPQFASIFSEASMDELEYLVMDGESRMEDRIVLPIAVFLDPFDEETVLDEKGNVITVPGDGFTAVHRKVDTHPVSQVYDDPSLAPFTSLVADMSAGDGEKGIFFDFPNVPEKFKSSGLRIFTTALSYPGPVAPMEKRPEGIFMCEQIDPCNEDEQRKLGEGPSLSGKKGVCAFFYASSAAWESKAMLEKQAMCSNESKPREMEDMKGYYDLNGGLTFPGGALRLWGPNFINNPAGPLGPVAPLDNTFHITYTTGVLRPGEEGAVDLLPDKRINLAKFEYKFNLTETNLETPRICEASVKNRKIHGEIYSSWKYVAPLLVRDEEGTIPAGCPEDGNSFTGGSAFLRGRPIDMETGIATFVASAKFADDPVLSFAFRNVMFFIAMNGWFCDPNGSEEDFQGKRCFDAAVNDRDALSMISIMK